MESTNSSDTQSFSNSTCAAVLHEHLESFLSTANRRVMELKKENEILQDEIKRLKRGKTKCDRCSNVYSTFFHLLQPDYVKMKKQPYVIEMKFPNTEAVINYIKASPNLQINNINKFLDKYSSTIS